jgi:mRNA interferase HigB
MHLVSQKVVRDFSARNPRARAATEQWVATIRAAEFKTMDDVVWAFSKAKALNGERVRFEIAGGDFRLIASFNFGRGWVYVKFIGSHAEYDKIDALTVSLF